VSPLALTLVVSAALVHATWNLLAKRAAAVGPAFVFAYNLVACVAYAPWAAWVVSRGATPPSAPVVACVLLSGAIHLAYSLALQRGYQVSDLSVVYPVARGTGPTLASLGAFALLGEAPRAHGVLGLVAVVCGIALISTDGDLAAFRGSTARVGLRWGFTTGGLIAGYTVVDAWGVKALGLHAVVLDWCGNTLRFVLLAPLVLSNRADAARRMRGHWRLAIGVGLLSPLSYILVLVALTRGAPVSLVAPAREMSMMVAAAFGMTVLGERVGPWRIAGCAVLVAGVVLLGRG
jgi:drug/metabolite transporter (DMT)-like permease